MYWDEGAEIEDDTTNRGIRVCTILTVMAGQLCGREDVLSWTNKCREANCIMSENIIVMAEWTYP